MSEIEKTLKESWNNIDYYQGGSLQLNVYHPLEWHVAYETESNKAIVIVSRYPIENIESSKSISAVCNRRKDKKYYISFQLLESNQEEVFISMCCNMFEYSENAPSEAAAIKMVAKRYNQWKRLMEKGNSGLLSDEKRKGLIGELLYLKEIINFGKSPKEAVDGWVGPDGADQDFVYDGIWREIKTTTLSSETVTIHSVEQLGKSADVGTLVIYRVDECAPETEEAFTLRGLIKGIVKITGFDGEFTDCLTSKLSEVGYIDMDAYDNYHYKYFEKCEYYVNADFPRITREELRSEITKCEYTIDIPSIGNWQKG